MSGMMSRPLPIPSALCNGSGGIAARIFSCSCAKPSRHHRDVKLALGVHLYDWPGGCRDLGLASARVDKKVARALLVRIFIQ